MVGLEGFITGAPSMVKRSVPSYSPAFEEMVSFPLTNERGSQKMSMFDNSKGGA